MSYSSNLDPVSFEKMLESASAVQQALTGIDSPFSPTKLREIIALRQLEFEAAMHAIAGHAREVANATGVAIAIIKRDELVYCAGSGTGANFRGRRRMATFILSSRGPVNREILRVEDADSDRRIEAAIWRQFGSKSLLILPLHKGGAWAGVLEVFFNEAHCFQEHEVGTYQMMARLAGQVIIQAAEIEERKAQSAANQRAVCPSCGAALVHPKQPLNTITVLAPIPAAQTMMHVPPRRRLWKLADAAAVMIVLVISCWIAYTYMAGEHLRALAQRSSDAATQHAAIQTSASLISKETRTFEVPFNVVSPTETESTPWKRMRVGNNEIDYISDDVTVRHFTRKPAIQRTHARNYRVDYLSEDVTVRRFIRNASAPGH